MVSTNSEKLHIRQRANFQQAEQRRHQRCGLRKGAERVERLRYEDYERLPRPGPENGRPAPGRSDGKF